MVSVVVPTRDRPEFLARCLQSLRAQTFDDFEVIVADNPGHQPSRSTFDEAADHRFRYLRPERPLTMHDNWEHACEHARGAYVAVLTDKMVLHATSLADLGTAVEHEPVDMISWWGEGYDLIAETRSTDEGRYAQTFRPTHPRPFDPMEELAFRCSMSVPRAQHGSRYFLGKICFGAYSAELLDRIRRRAGRAFLALAPDYTSMVLAAPLARGALDLGRPAVLSVNSAVSNGRKCEINPEDALRFVCDGLGTNDGAERLPIPGLYSAVHNVVAYNFAGAIPEECRADVPQLNLGNLARRSREDMSGVHWLDLKERAQQYAILGLTETRLRLAAVSAKPKRPRWLPRLRRAVLAQTAGMPALEQALRRLSRRPGHAPREYSTILEAVKDADRYANGS